MTSAHGVAHPSNTSLIWLFVRWLPSVALVSMLTLWAPVLMGGMARVIGWLFLVFLAPAGGLFIAVAVGLYAAVRRRFSRPIVSALVLSTLVILPGLWPKGILAVPYPTPENVQPQLGVRLPVDAPMRVYWGGNSLATNYHALYPDQRFAYDLVVEPAGILSERNEDYGCWAKPVVAPIDGTVLVSHDGEPDQTPTRVADVEVFAGNHVVIKNAQTETFLLVAHLQQGSVAVKAGQQVSAGDPIGRCGNSGRTSEPHVHLHHQRQEPGPFPLGVAEGLPIFFVGVQGPTRPVGGAEKEEDRIRLTGDLLRPQETTVERP